MMTVASKLITLLKAPNRYERIECLAEIRLNNLLYPVTAVRANPPITFEEFCDSLANYSDPLLPYLISPECMSAVQSVRNHFAEVAALRQLPYPTLYNADLTLAKLAYGIVRQRKPSLVLETGVGYGITSALILDALNAEGSGRLVSLDLPSLSDTEGTHTGLAVAEHHRRRWTLHRNVSSRGVLSKVVTANAPIDVFMSDSANVHTLQRFEFKTVWPSVPEEGRLVFNNVSEHFLNFLYGQRGARVWTIWQVEKQRCVTALVEKTRFTI
jgi:predicted O-methyltransferase YrrM